MSAKPETKTFESSALRERSTQKSHLYPSRRMDPHPVYLMVRKAAHPSRTFVQAKCAAASRPIQALHLAAQRHAHGGSTAILLWAWRDIHQRSETWSSRSISCVWWVRVQGRLYRRIGTHHSQHDGGNWCKMLYLATSAANSVAKSLSQSLHAALAQASRSSVCMHF